MNETIRDKLAEARKIYSKEEARKIVAQKLVLNLGITGGSLYMYKQQYEEIFKSIPTKVQNGELEIITNKDGSFTIVKANKLVLKRVK